MKKRFYFNEKKQIYFQYELELNFYKTFKLILF